MSESTPLESVDTETEIQPAQVAAYLTQHEDFFQHHKALLASLQLPHETGKSVSLVERQVGILRERNMDMRRRMNELVQTARDNDDLFTKTRTLTLALLDCNNLQELNEVLATHVLVDFEADFVSCHLLANNTLANNAASSSLDHICISSQISFEHLLGSARASCTPLRDAEMLTVFPMILETGSGSAVTIKLEFATGDGVLAIGSRDATRFSSDMDTLFVTYIADILTKVLRPMIQSPA